MDTETDWNEDTNPAVEKNDSHPVSDSIPETYVIEVIETTEETAEAFNECDETVSHNEETAEAFNECDEAIFRNEMKENEDSHIKYLERNDDAAEEATATAAELINSFLSDSEKEIAGVSNEADKVIFQNEMKETDLEFSENEESENNSSIIKSALFLFPSTETTEESNLHDAPDENEECLDYNDEELQNFILNEINEKEENGENENKLLDEIFVKEENTFITSPEEPILEEEANKKKKSKKINFKSKSVIFYIKKYNEYKKAQIDETSNNYFYLGETKKTSETVVRDIPDVLPPLDIAPQMEITLEEIIVAAHVAAPAPPPPVPKIIFIVPYRDREQQYKFYSKHMKNILEDYSEDEYKIFYIHQCDDRSFNRGAMKNIGFIYVKKTYPNHYRNITLVFNDIDVMPYSKNFLNYDTFMNNVKHFYGFTYTLGGIVSIKAGDFERINGFPNFWAWGYEDNMLQKRVLNSKMNIDRNQFYPVMDKNIMLLHDGLTRLINRKEFDRYLEDTREGIYSIRNLEYDLDEKGFVNVRNFMTEYNESKKDTAVYDTRIGPRPFGNTIFRKNKKRMSMIF